MSFTADYRNIVLDCVFGVNASSEMPATIDVGLLSPEGVECTGTGYARVEVDNDGTTFPPASSAMKRVAIDVEFAAAAADWGEIGQAGLYEPSGGDLICTAVVAGGVLGPMPAGVTPRIPANTLTIFYPTLT